MDDTERDFVGVKAALLYQDSAVTILRDDIPGLNFAGLWDFPGGGREARESPFACLAREVREELTIEISRARVRWVHEFPSMLDPGAHAFFMAVDLTKRDIERIVLGDEGQDWRLMRVSEILTRDDVVPHIKGRLQGYLNFRDSDSAR